MPHLSQEDKALYLRMKENAPLALFQAFLAMRSMMTDMVKKAQGTHKSHSQEDKLETTHAKAPTLAEVIDSIMPDVLKKISEMKPQNGHTPTKTELSEIIAPLIPKVSDGHTPTRSELRAIIMPLIPKPKHGKTPTKSELIKLMKSVLPKVRELKPETGKTIVDKVNSLPIDPRFQIDASHVKNLPKYRDKKTKKGGVMRGGGDLIYTADLSSQTNGITKTFTVPFSTKAIMVFSSDFPSVLFEGNGFSVSSDRRQLTLTITNAPSQGSQLGFLYTI